jgi:steroid delta-isomerase-like uncharacterized protein
MRSTKYGALFVGIILSACGGGADEQKPVESPAPSGVAVNSATTAQPVETTPPEAPKPSMADLQTAGFKAWFAALNAHDGDKMASLCTDDVVFVHAGNPETMNGKDAVKGGIGKLFTAFPDAKFAASRTWQKGDVMAIEFGWTGTNSGEFMSMKATNKPVGTMGLGIFWFSPDGKIKQAHQYMDGGSVAMQLGVPKAQGRALVGLPTTVETHVATNAPDEDKGVELAKTMASVMEKKDTKAFLDGLTDDATYDMNTAPGSMTGKKDAEKWFKAMTKAFPDLKNNVTGAWGIGDYVIDEYEMTGTQKGPLSMGKMTLPPTGKSVDLHGAEILQFKDGKMVKGWGYENGVEFAMELGLMKPPGQAAAKAAAAATPAKATK